LRGFEEEYWSLVERMPEVIYSEDEVEDITSMNKALRSMFGFTAIEIISGNITEFIPREALPKAIAVLDQIHEGIDVTVETIMVNGDGRISDFELDSVPIVFTANLSIKLNGGEKTIEKC